MIKLSFRTRKKSMLNRITKGGTQWAERPMTCQAAMGAIGGNRHFSVPEPNTPISFDRDNSHMLKAEQNTVRILLMEEEALVRAALQALVASWPGFQIIAEASTKDEA